MSSYTRQIVEEARAIDRAIASRRLKPVCTFDDLLMRVQLRLTASTARMLERLVTVDERRKKMVELFNA